MLGARNDTVVNKMTLPQRCQSFFFFLAIAHTVKYIKWSNFKCTA